MMKSLAQINCNYESINNMEKEDDRSLVIKYIAVQDDKKNIVKDYITEEIYRRHHQLLFGYVYKHAHFLIYLVGLDEEEVKKIAEDLTQDTWFKFFRTKTAKKWLDNYNCSLTSFLCSIAKNEYRNWYRKNIKTGLKGIHNNPSDNFDWIMILSDLDICIKYLGDEDKRLEEVIVLHYKENLTLEEIQQKIGYKYNINNVASIHNFKEKAYNLLQKCLSDKGWKELPDGNHTNIISWPTNWFVTPKTKES